MTLTKSPVTKTRQADLVTSDSDSVNSGFDSNASNVKRQKNPIKVKKMKFIARSSRLDSEVLNKEDNSFRGFFTFFWISLVYYVLFTCYKSYKSQGIIFSLSFFFHMTTDGLNLFTLDMMMVISCFVVVFLQKLINYGLIPLELSIIVHTVYIRDWPWVQSGFFVMHSMAMLMKQHSYLSVNREMKQKLTLKLLKEKLKFTLISELKNNSDILETTTENLKLKAEIDEKIVVLEEEIDDLMVDLKNNNTMFPANVTLFNFLDFLLIPTLVYEIEYPRTKRPFYFLEKVFAIFGSFFLLYLTAQQYILPTLEEIPKLEFIETLFQLLFPFLICWFMIFFIIFEGICNAFAELTLFADRDFYDDWWNSTSFEEFARKWNKPVHEFLLLPLIYLSKLSAVREQKLLGNVVFWFCMLLVSLLYGHCS
ncbi:hypothetical protein HK099_004546 [Clydaea vesicula]|uniref:O-acyltransferase n=1 Tax=Clydaea vesicula TaxID=447962 RepID=A0AAD5U1T2_9FUNG|nr:hypothetical protein HK099_004546 [Clydaea vesicula]